MPPAAAILLLLALAGCTAAIDPFQREGTWRARHVNDANLRAMIANPAHLDRGVGDDRGRSRQAADAIQRLEDDALKPLPEVRTSPVGASAGGRSGR
ncbi:hypothetical protein [Elioraea thermophila]|uniref:hypothetical protein n=1 Tax=Elioraea thermophila TaxID=2185104 RepID=UPI000DF3154C|nr:hypothetical protein [Elioraea thermophila]